MGAVTELADPQRAASAARFFQAGPGGYGEGDEFIGVSVPKLRAVARRFRGVTRPVVVELLASPVHELRLIALLLLHAEFERADPNPRSPDSATPDSATPARAATAWVECYRRQLERGRVNNWDLVDTSAAPILGEWCWRHDDFGPLVDLAADQDLWRRRAGVVGTHAYLRHGDSAALRAVAAMVIGDRRPLIEKALGWMLREWGARIARVELIEYLQAHAAQLGRTALSYSIEHLEPEQRAYYRSLR